jgi:sorting nexin-29
MKEKMPHEWKRGIICPLYKKGDTMECSNYRGITLLNIAYKVLSNIIFSWLVPYVENNIGAYQGGFRPGKSTINQILTLRQILEKTIEFGIGTDHLFIDFKLAYDSINREQLYMAMRDLDIQVKLIRMVEVIMTDVKSSVRVGGYLSEPITVRNGLRQGDALACLLFNIALEKVIWEAGVQTRGTIFYKSVQILAYAGDVDIIGRSLLAMEEAFLAIESAGRKMGLVINETKTKYMAAGKAYIPNMPPNLIIANYTFARIDSFIYLGCTVSYNNDISEEIGARLVATNRAYFGH